MVHSKREGQESTRQCRPIQSSRMKSARVPSSVKRSAYKRWPKPPYSYVGLIAMAIMTSPSGSATLAEIYDALQEWFPFFRGGYNGWRDSVRHNLTYSKKIFQKNLRCPTRPNGKSNDWTMAVDQVEEKYVTLQSTAESRSAEYAPTVHEHLGLPSIWQLEKLAPQERARLKVKMNNLTQEGDLRERSPQQPRSQQRQHQSRSAGQELQQKRGQVGGSTSGERASVSHIDQAKWKQHSDQIALPALHAAMNLSLLQQRPANGSPVSGNDLPSSAQESYRSMEVDGRVTASSSDNTNTAPYHHLVLALDSEPSSCNLDLLAATAVEQARL